MANIATTELYDVFDARRVKAPELRGLDLFVNRAVGFVRNRLPMLKQLRMIAQAVEKLEKEIQPLSDARLKEAAADCQTLARLQKLDGPHLERALAIAREVSLRTLGKRPYPVQIMGAAGMIRGWIIEMATGEGKTIAAAVAASVMALSGRPVHVITVNDYLVQRDADEMGPLYRGMGVDVGAIVHETERDQRFANYRRGILYITSKELVADFLRDQLMLGHLRNASQTAIGSMARNNRQPLLIPGLWRVIVDEADSLLIDEAVTPLIISNSPNTEPNEKLYRAAAALADRLHIAEDFMVDRTVRSVDLTSRGRRKLEDLIEELPEWKGLRRCEELVVQALVAKHCYHRDEQYLLDEKQRVQIIDESTGRVMPDRSWRHGLHQAIEVKENAPVTPDKENLARLSFQRFFRQYPHMGGMTGTAWESAGEIWQIYQRPIVRVPTNRPCIRQQLPIRMFDTAEEKYKAVIQRICELNDKQVPVLVGTRSVASSEYLAAALAKTGRSYRVLNATQTAQEASIVAEAGLPGKITVATNMAGRGTDIRLGKGVAKAGGLHVIATEPHSSSRIDRQLYGRAARQGDPGCAQLFASAEDDLFVRHANQLRKAWKSIGSKTLIRIAQAAAERLARGNRAQVLKSDDWMDEALPF